MDKHLHIITHDIPWPADYGGVVDLLYKIKTLHWLGVRVHLHCYHSNKSPQPSLLAYCESVNYYARKGSRSAFSPSLPHIVNSRRDPALLQNLLKDKHPILLEGIHCSYLLQEGALKGRKVFVRLHNVEFKYYRNLAAQERNLFKRAYFLWESKRLEKYERKLATKATFWAVSEKDVQVYKKELGAQHVLFLPVFLPWSIVDVLPGRGTFCLYHGNLSVNENERAAAWLLEHVFAKLDIPFVIAGKDPSASLQSLAHRYQHTCIVVNPTEAEMQDLLRKAQVNVLPAFNETGVKLKLMNALFNGRHCISNTAGFEGSGLETLCEQAETEDQFREQVQKCFQQEFSPASIEARQEIFDRTYNNEKNGRQLIAWIY